MPKVSDAFPSNYLKADVDVPDLEDGGIVLTIKTADMVEFDDGQKLALYFEEIPKGLILNKTNANTLTDLFKSDDTDDWEGRKVKLYAKDVEYQGKITRGIRVATRLPKNGKPAPVAAGGRDFDETDDGIADPPSRRPADDQFEV